MGTILVTGSAGFIGYHLCKRLLDRGDTVIGIDNLNDYYDVRLKEARLRDLKCSSAFTFLKTDIADRNQMAHVFKTAPFKIVVHLAAQPGVRYSLINPYAYIESNVVGFMNILEGCRHAEIGHLVYASSSSIYGTNLKMPFSVHHNVDHPISLYAATKKSNELMAHTYSALYNIPTTGLRFFTVYGPWGRPDMALFSFTRAILDDRPIDVYNNGNMKRDFTYIDDIIEGIVRVMERAPRPCDGWDRENPDPGTSYAPYKLYNIGNNEPVNLLHFIEVLENCLGKKARKNMLPIQPGDVPETYADIDNLIRDVGFRPSTPLAHGVKKFVEWYKGYYL